MSPTILHQFWFLVERIQESNLSTLDDETLAQWIMRQAHHHLSISNEELNHLNTYVLDRIPLIRELMGSPLPNN
jgi:hypothetical protein